MVVEVDCPIDKHKNRNVPFCFAGYVASVSALEYKLKKTLNMDAKKLKRSSALFVVSIVLCLIAGGSGTLAHAAAKPLGSISSNDAAGDGSILGAIDASSNAKGQIVSTTNRKLSTELLQLANAVSSGEVQTSLLSKLRNLKEFVTPGDSLGTIDKKIPNQTHGDLAYVYVTVAPTAQTSIVDPMVWKVIDRDEKDHLVVALVAPDELTALAALSGVSDVRLVTPPTVNIGSVDAQGDSILETDKVRTEYGQDGTGMKIGVISDGVDHLSDAVATGDLPSNVDVISNSVGGDEGTAMLEIVHDMAPGASLYFHDSGTNVVAFDSAVDALVAAGANVIVDDVSWVQEPYFQDGTVASHIASVLASDNVVYVSAAGNYAETHFEGTYDPLGTSTLNDFSGGTSSTSPSLYINMPVGSTVAIVLQWNDTFGSSDNDYDLYLSDITPGQVALVASSTDSQTGAGSDPIEEITYTNTTGAAFDGEIDVNNYLGKAAPKTLDLFIFPDANVGVYSNNLDHPAGSIWGQAAVPGVIAVGAINASDTGNVDIEPYSSEGPVTIIGQAQRTKPDIAGIDGVSVSGAGGFPTTFLGTSAAAPGIAAIAAQLWAEYPSSTASQITNHLLNSAVDLGAPGIDDVFGHGRADALLAVQSGPSITSFGFTAPAATGTISVASGTVSVTVPFGTSITTLTPTIAISGTSISPASGASQDFTHPVAYTVTGSDGLVRTYWVTVTVSAQVVPPPPTISVATSTPGTATVGVPYTATVTATSTNATDTFAWTVTGLPSWMATGTSNNVLTLSGTPNATGTSNIAISVKGANPSSTAATANYALTALAAPTISILTNSLPNATSGVLYGVNLAATSTNQSDAFTWSIASGTLPNGLALTSSTGRIAGTPGIVGTSTFMVRVKGANPSSTAATASLSIFVSAAPLPPPPTISVATSTPGTATVGVPYTATVTATSTNATDTFAWTVTGLPSWMATGTSNNVLTLSGTPNATGTSNIAISVKGANPSSTAATANYALTALAAPTISILTNSLPNATSGVLYGVNLAATSTNQSDAFTWSIASGTLPNGLALTSSTGRIAGTPGIVGTSTFMVRVKGANPSSTAATASLSIFVSAAPLPPPPTISVATSTPGTATVGVPYTATVTATSTNATDTFAWTVTGLPSWMATGTSNNVLTLSGTPNATGTSNIAISVKGANPSSTAATANYALTADIVVQYPPVINSFSANTTQISLDNPPFLNGVLPTLRPYRSITGSVL